MAHGYTPQLPSIFPDEDVTVENEEHRYQTYQGDSGSILEQTEYTLDKAPVQEILEIRGTHDGADGYVFSQGTDYVLADLTDSRQEQFTYSADEIDYVFQNPPDTGTIVVEDDSGNTYTQGTDYTLVSTHSSDPDTIRWDTNQSTPDIQQSFSVSYDTTFEDSIVEWQSNPAARPDAGSNFYVDYRSESLIKRYIASSNEEFESVEDELNSVIQGKFVDSASGRELDEMGKLFGQLGKRSGRQDPEYRTYLKSVVQSFVSRGTKNGIKLAISAATGVDIEDITIQEDFQNNEYDVALPPNTPIQGSTIEEIAEIADPSGVDQDLTRFEVGPEEIVISDDATFTEGQIIDEDVATDDSVVVNPNKLTLSDDIAADDEVTVDPNTLSIADEMGGDDTVIIDPNTLTIAEVSGSDDEVSRIREEDKNLFRWARVEEISGDTWSNSSWDSAEWVDFGNVVEGDNWDFMEWSDLSDLGTILIAESSGSTDELVAKTKNNDSFRWTENLDVADTSAQWESDSWNSISWATEERSEDTWNFMEWTA